MSTPVSSDKPTNGNMQPSWQRSRRIIDRIVIEGTLVLETPASFGNGDNDALTDVPLLRDPLDGLPLLTGASIAGALRSYLREVQGGYNVREKQDGVMLAEQLFGHLDNSDEENKASVQSWLIVDDALGKVKPVTELRDEVAIDTKTRTAEIDKRGKGKKFDVELLPVGTTFDLRFELHVPEKTDELRIEPQELLNGLMRALCGFQRREIGLGRRKKRGYGQCHVARWTMCRYQMTDMRDLVAWLNDDTSRGETADFSEQTLSVRDERQAFSLDATFKLDGSLLIRSGSGTGNAPDAVHLHSPRNGEDVPIVSGTSGAGAIRARAYRIANTLARDEAKAKALIDSMFGPRIEKSGDQPRGSRVTVHETEIVNPPPSDKSLVQSRVKIDRFTGGAYPQALFSEQPVFAADETRIKIELLLRKPYDADERQFRAEVGLLLLVLKDLWTGDLPLGGESSVGRGRLQGESATIKCDGKEWILTEKEIVDEKDGAQQKETVIEITGNGIRDDLENYVTAFKSWATREAQ